MTTPTPSVIRKSDPRRIEIDWDDGHTSVLTAAELRALCPCAQCVNEVTGVRMHDASTVPDDLSQSNLHLVGNYAVSMTFSDGHHTGIFTFPFLRRHGRSPA